MRATTVLRVPVLGVPVLRVPVLGASLLCACASEPPSAGAAIEPGVGIGEVRLGMTYGERRAELGEAERALVSNRIGFARYPERGLEVVLTSPGDTLGDDAIVVGVGASEGADVSGPARPGDLRSGVEERLGPAPDESESFAFYSDGLSLEYDGDRVLRVGVFEPFERRPEVPEMRGTR